MRTIHPALLTSEVPVFFATSEGQTRRIASRLAELLRERGFESRAIDVTSPDVDDVDWTRVRAAVVGASLHMGRHQRQAARFVRRYAATLSQMPTAFFSVSLSAASAKAEEVDAARTIAEGFGPRLGWHPRIVACIAGALVYTKYGWLKRRLMQRIARAECGPTDTGRDHELTNWQAVADFADRIQAMATPRATSAA